MKALPINVYRTSGPDCTNGGISEMHNQLLLICDEGYIEIDENNPPANLVKISEHHCGFSTYKFIEPVARPQHLGWMFGGNLAYSSDDRYGRMAEYPLPIHDRQEYFTRFPLEGEYSIITPDNEMLLSALCDLIADEQTYKRYLKKGKPFMVTFEEGYKHQLAVCETDKVFAMVDGIDGATEVRKYRSLQDFEIK